MIQSACCMSRKQRVETTLDRDGRLVHDRPCARARDRARRALRGAALRDAARTRRGGRARRGGRCAGGRRDRGLDGDRRRSDRRPRRRGRCGDRRRRRAPARRNAGRAGADRCGRRRRPRPCSPSCPSPATSRRWRCPCSPCGSAAPSPSATPACALSPRTDHREEADPRCHRRPHAVDARGHARAQGGSLARAARRARPLPPRDLDVPVVDAGLPLGARDGSAPRCARDSASRLVPPGRAAARRVRLVVRCRARGGHEAVADRHDLRAQRQPSRQERGDRSTKRWRTPG